MSYSILNRKKDALDKAYVKENLNIVLENLKKMSQKYEKLEILNVGRMLEGVGYFHETDEYYKCVGFEVHTLAEFKFGSEKLISSEDVGFHSIWVGKSHEVAPVIFQESYQKLGEGHRFENGFGDHFEVEKELLTVEEVQKLI